MNLERVWPHYDKLLHNSGVKVVGDPGPASDLAAAQVSLASGLHYTYSHLQLEAAPLAISVAREPELLPLPH